MDRRRATLCVSRVTPADAKAESNATAVLVEGQKLQARPSTPCIEVNLPLNAYFYYPLRTKIARGF
jgi:hypothetical protein